MDFGDLSAFVAHPRVTSLTASRDGSRVVVSVQTPDRDGGRYVSSLWEVDPDGQRQPQRLTFSDKGESSPRFTPDGRLLFASSRPDPETEEDATATALWELPDRGEARVIMDAPAGLSLQGIAGDGSVLATTSVLAGGNLRQDAAARKDRRSRKVSAILHTGMPVRLWDHELGDTITHLVLGAPDGDEDGGGRLRLRDLTPGASPTALVFVSADLSEDGARVATTWTSRVKGGGTRTSLALIDIETGRRTTLLPATAGHGWSAPLFSRDGDRLALIRSTASTPTDTSYPFLEIHRLGPDGLDEARAPLQVDLGDLTPSEYVWSADSTVLYVTGALHSRGAVLAVDARDGGVEVLYQDAVYSDLHPTDDGTSLWALRTTVDTPASPVRLSTQGTDVTTLKAPGGIAELPGRLERITTEVDGQEVGAWLCTPRGASSADPAPLMVWVHGGPHSSFNSWSWRWCPWVAVARGWAVLMPDPAMSTGFGHAGLNRGWPRRAGVVWAEVEALADRALRRSTLDPERTALLGASFGGFMTNWIAGQSDRFGAIVTHAGLYALDQQHTTTDMAAFKMAVHQRPDQAPEWYAQNSPHHRAAHIRTPMLITHGSRDYRVPISEALRLWWDLVSGHQGSPASMPHRFLQFTGQNHWILTPSDSRIWYQVVLDFCDHHVRGLGTAPAQLPQW